MIAKLPDTTPEVVKQRLRESLVEKPRARTLPHPVNTGDDKILVTNLDDPAWQGLDRTTQLTTNPADIDAALTDLLAKTVAPASPQSAENVAIRVLAPMDDDKQRPLIKLLGCRLQAQSDAKQVTLSANTLEALRKATGPCDQPSR